MFNPLLFQIVLYAVISAIGCYVYYKWAQKKQIVDTPNERSSHTHQPVRGMGVVFPVLFAMVSIQIWGGNEFLFAHSPIFPMYRAIGLLWIGFAVLLIGLTGYLDDRIDLRSYIRLPLYLVSTILGLIPLIMTWSLGVLWLGIILIVIVGIINTYNFMDGINGITGFYSMVLFASLYYLFYMTSLGVYVEEFTSTLLFAVIFLVAFGFYNFRHKSLAFLGDAGSVSLGLFACIVLVWAGSLHDRFDVVVLLLVYGVDSVGTIFLRLLRRENIFRAHRNHLYQDLVHIKGLSHLKVAFIYAFIQVIINVQYFYYFEHNNIVLYIYLCGLVSIYLICKKSLGTLQLSIKNS
jgi:UDP-GlcNAc:undecaprenyl-phosphate/decaprenyl-phosphate GlcNAc-1-phosphate transferase